MQQQQPSDEVLRLAGEGRKIEAIKRYRGESGAGLADAKAVVDSLPRDRSVREPKQERPSLSANPGLFVSATLIGLIGLWVTGTGLLKVAATSGWLLAEGSISEVQRVQGIGRAGDQVAVSYDYTVSGETFTGNQISFTLIFGPLYNDALLARYSPSSSIYVYYDPDQPSSSVLDRSIPTLYWLVFIFSAAGFLYGLRAWNRSARRERREKTSE